MCVVSFHYWIDRGTSGRAIGHAETKECGKGVVKMTLTRGLTTKEKERECWVRASMPGPPFLNSLRASRCLCVPRFLQRVCFPLHLCICKPTCAHYTLFSTAAAAAASSLAQKGDCMWFPVHCCVVVPWYGCDASGRLVTESINVHGKNDSRRSLGIASFLYDVVQHIIEHGTPAV